MFVVDLFSSEKVESFDVGNKASNLIKLKQNGINVPGGIVLKSNAYNSFIKKNHLSDLISDFELKIKDESLINKESKIIRDAIEKGTIPEEILDQLNSYSFLFDTHPVAIRSSGNLEDLMQASFAGQYDTFLNVIGLGEVLFHIKKCYASLWNERAILYRKNNNISYRNINLAIIIQKMVNAKSSGVLFTCNPLNSDKYEIIVESNFGLGESIVSGIVTPDEYVLHRGKENKIKIQTKRIGNKLFTVRPKRDIGVECLHSPEDIIEASSLSNKELYQLANLGIKIEDILKNYPQDIEWAIDYENIIHILQSRPITTFNISPDAKQVLWSRGYSDDYWNDNTTPLFFELLGTQLTKVVNMELNSIMGYKEIDAQLLKLFKGHVYFNLNVLKKKVEYEIPPFMRNQDVLNYFPNGFGQYGKSTIKNLPFHLKNYIFAQIRIKFYDPNGAMSRTAEVYEKWTQNVFIPFCKEFDAKLAAVKKNPDKLIFYKLSKELNEVMVSHFRLVRYGIPIHNIGMNLLTQYLLNRFLGTKLTQKLFPILISGLKHKLTETNDHIHQLAFLINRSDHLKDIFLKNDINQLFDILKRDQSQDAKLFLIKFKNFLDEYGDRGFTREPYYPRWHEEPRLIFAIIKSLLTGNFTINKNIKEEQAKTREKVERYVETKIRNQSLGFLKWLLLSTILKNSRKYIIFRENQRFNLDSWISRIRMLYLELGQIFKDEGILDEKNNIFFLFLEEIKELISDKNRNLELKKKIKKRINNFKKYEDSLPPKFLIGSKEFDDVRQYNKDSEIYKGIPASYGIITGPVHIITNIAQISTIQSGEILIVPRTDPGWTPVFSKIGGLITETGGILSHGAVVSREYGIPAVTNVTKATKLFQDNQMVYLNGYNGIIKTIKKK
ncbi:MAG: hypothetical protein EU532_06160 [Promethearchaeota archaeon]|nr:MAG: hypothetical protein EU532_06160 [Candidatus Lokiarchaeota archaeon]